MSGDKLVFGNIKSVMTQPPGSWDEIAIPIPIDKHERIKWLLEALAKEWESVSKDYDQRSRIAP